MVVNNPNGGGGSSVWISLSFVASVIYCWLRKQRKLNKLWMASKSKVVLFFMEQEYGTVGLRVGSKDCGEGQIYCMVLG